MGLPRDVAPSWRTLSIGVHIRHGNYLVLQPLIIDNIIELGEVGCVEIVLRTIACNRPEIIIQPTGWQVTQSTPPAGHMDCVTYNAPALLI